MHRLLDAAEDLLREEGVEGATLRAIADRAGVSVGIVYRRFRDKDAVLRAVYMRFFEAIDAGNRRALARAAQQTATTEQILTMVVRGIADGYRTHRDLVRALVLYARTHPDAKFRNRARALNAVAYKRIQQLLLARRRRILHNNPKKAVAFAVSVVATMLQERILFNDVTALPPMSDRELVKEATQLLAGYLLVRRRVFKKRHRQR